MLVTCRHLDRIYESNYLVDICCAELVRNCCVNLGIDPDMTGGIVANVDVFLVKNGVSKLWNYIPSANIGKYGVLIPTVVHSADLSGVGCKQTLALQFELVIKT